MSYFPFNKRRPVLSVFSANARLSKRQRIRAPSFRRGGKRNTYRPSKFLPVSRPRTYVKIPLSVPGFMPQMLQTHYSYNDFFADTTAGGFVDWVYRGNSVYDPDFGAGGQTPLGFPQMTNVYGTYKVLASKVDLTVVNNDADLPVMCSITPDQSSASYAVARNEAIQGCPHAVSDIIANQAGEKKLFNSMATKTIYGVKDLDSVNFEALYNANPSSPWFWHITLDNGQGGAGTALNCTVRLRITYYVLHSQLRNSQFTVA